MNSNRLYKNRTLTDNVNMVFDFVGENWRKWFKMMAYFLLPFSVLLGTMLANFDIETPSFGMTLVASGILFFVGCAVVNALQILLLKWHETHNGTLDGCDMGAMWRMLPQATLKCLVVILIGTPAIVVANLFNIIPFAGLVAVFALLPVFLICPIMLLEPNDSLMNNIKRAFSLGHKKWGRLILITLIMGVVSFLINNAITFPRGIYTILDSIFQFSTTDSVFWSFLIDFLNYVLSVAQCFMIFVEMGLFVLAMTYYYGSVATEVEDIGLESDIDNFAQLK